jgi:tetratricopeptide (TPR) repeat protein
MAVSFSQPDCRTCPACGTPVASEIWLILHRVERPSLWARCGDGTIHHTFCRGGHRGIVRAPLLLYDTRLEFAVFSPAPLADDKQARADSNSLLERLQSSISPAEQFRTLGRIEMVPRDLLGRVLSGPRLNAHDFAPGADPGDELNAAYRILKQGDFGLVEQIIESGDATPALTAALQFEAGMWSSRVGGTSPEACDQAIRYLHATLDFYTRELFPHRWAAVHSELGLCFRYRRTGDATHNLREAVRCSDAALEVFRIEEYPEDYAITQSNRASALVDLKDAVTGSVEKGIEAYREALRVYNRESYPDSWALVSSNLATALMERGAPQDLQDAACGLQGVLEAGSRTGNPQQSALAKMHLGLVLRLLPERKQESIDALRAAYAMLRNASPRERLASTYNLGLALARSGHLEDLPEAARLLEQAHAAMIDDGPSAELSDCTNQLASVYATWARNTPGLCTEICARALRALESEQDAEAVGITFHELARLLNESPGVSETDLAARTAKRALCILRTKAQAEYRAKVLSNLGMIYLRQGAKSRALSCFSAAMRVFEKLEPTSERTEAMGQLHILSARAGGDQT